jgi:hypothetical protein
MRNEKRNFNLKGKMYAKGTKRACENRFIEYICIRGKVKKTSFPGGGGGSGFQINIKTPCGGAT